MKKLLSFLIVGVAFLTLVFPVQASEPAQVLIINQVRGTECCEPGTTEALQKQLDFLTQQQLPAFFTLRWDVLSDPRFIEIIQQADSELFSWGVFLEITPALAAAAEVNYAGTSENWYQAQYAYTLGYSPVDREKLVDTIMAKYEEIFSEHPALTTSWIIDTPTLNYLHDEYEVKVHQITREQWGTDSYTIYGGPPHYPYPASRNWALIPDYTTTDPTLIVRQTLTDPVWNYGDTQSRFTSQPNDFSQDGKGFDYFEKLLNQALFEQSPNQVGFALLGLENSMADKYQQLFQRQLELVVDYQQQGRVVVPDLATLQQTWQGAALTTYQGHDLVKNTSSQSIWITGENYRVRVIKKDNQVCIDDVRLFSNQLQDYYTDHQAQDLSYWVTPFLVDGSRFYTHEKSWFSKEYASNGMTPLPDMITKPECWDLPLAISAQDQLRLEQVDIQTVAVNYESEEGSTQLIFKLTSFQLPPEIDAKLAWSVNGEVAYELSQKCTSKSCWYTPQVNPTVFAQAQEAQASSFLPEQRAGDLSTTQSRLYADNPYAVAGRNPVRVVFMPRDEQGVAVKLESPPEIISQVDLITDPTSVLEDDPQFYDFMSEQPAQTTVNFKVGEKLNLETEVYFAPNCKTNPKYCLLHPRQAWWYLKSWVGDKQRLLQEKLYKIRTY